LVNKNYIIQKKLRELINEADIEPSDVAINNICNSKKFCDSQGPITFGQLRELVETGRVKRIGVHMAEGGYKGFLRLLPWFIPQLAIAGFGATWIRIANKLFRPTLEETSNYKTWWGKTIMKVFDLVEGELNTEDPLSKIFFVSDGLMTMLNEKYKIKFANYIANLASDQPDDKIVPELFVENELRNWLNKKFMLNPPLPPKYTNFKNNEDLPFEEINKGDIKKRIFSENLDTDELKWHFDQNDRDVYIVESDGWRLQMDDELPRTLKKGDKVFIPKGKYHRVLKGSGNLVVEIKEYLTEKRSGYRNYIREIVSDIIIIFKQIEEGTFVLPEDLHKDKLYYEFPKLKDNIQVELSISENTNVNKFYVDASYYHTEGVITVEIDYNPNNKRSMMYELVGELNEIIAHELRHVEQKSKGSFKFSSVDDFEEVVDPFEYYTQPKELDAQLKGFKRLSFMTKKPLTYVVKNWFDTHKEIHGLDEDEAKKVIDKILNYR